MRRRVLEWTDPMTTLAAAASSNGIDYLRSIVSGAAAPPPMAIVMNLSLESVERGRVVFTGMPGEEHYNPHGTVHGGYASTIFDTALGCAIHSTLDRGIGYTTLDLHVHFVRPITRATGTVRCEATVLHEGKRVATAEGKLYGGDGQLLGHATTTCLIFPREPSLKM